jgi:hypothetical protein
MHIPTYNPKWMTITGLFVIACAVGWSLHSSSSEPVTGFESERASSGPYADAFGNPGVVAPLANGSSVSFEIGTDGTGKPVVISADAISSRTRVHLANGPDGLSGSADAVTPAYPPVGNAPAAPAAPSSSGSSSAPAPTTTTPHTSSGSGSGSGQMMALQIPPFLPEKLFTPLPGAKTRGVAISEWESYRTDVAGKNILVTTDDSNVFRDRDGKLNGNTGDTDASGLNVTDATDAVIFGTESADEAPYQTVAQALVDILTGSSQTDDPGSGDDSDDDGDANDPDPGANPEDIARTAATAATSETGGSGSDELANTDTGDPRATLATMQTASAVPVATAAVIAPDPSDETPDEDDEDVDDDAGGSAEFDFPYVEWVNQISSDSSSAIHTDEGTTLASGADALVIGGDGFDDDDNRAAGENIVIARDDSHIVLGGTGDVNAQIGDSEQGAVIMDVNRVYIQGGGAY